MVLGDYERALKDHDAAVRLNPFHPLGFVNRAIAHKALGSDEEAQQEEDGESEEGGWGGGGGGGMGVLASAAATASKAAHSAPAVPRLI